MFKDRLKQQLDETLNCIDNGNCGSHAAIELTPSRDFLCISLIGSQNYNLADENSDVDSKLIVFPTLENIYRGSRMISSTHFMSDTNEHVDVKDIRAFFSLLEKENVNYSELLFTDNIIVNDYYLDLWNILVENREAIATCNKYKLMKSCKGICIRELGEAFENESLKMPLGYNPKKVASGLRVLNFSMNIANSVSFAESLVYDDNDREIMLALKRGDEPYNLPYDKMYEYAMSLRETMSLLEENFNAGREDSVDKETESLLQYVNDEMMKRYLKKELEWL